MVLCKGQLYIQLLNTKEFEEWLLSNHIIFTDLLLFDNWRFVL